MKAPTPDTHTQTRSSQVSQYPSAIYNVSPSQREVAVAEPVIQRATEKGGGCVTNSKFDVCLLHVETSEKVRNLYELLILYHCSRGP